MKKIICPVGGIWEEKQIEIRLDLIQMESAGTKSDPIETKLPCPHAAFIKNDFEYPEYKNTPDDAIHAHMKNYRADFYRIPRVIIAKNEGGYSSTGVCLDCVNEQFEKLQSAAEEISDIF